MVHLAWHSSRPLNLGNVQSHSADRAARIEKPTRVRLARSGAFLETLGARAHFCVLKRLDMPIPPAANGHAGILHGLTHARALSGTVDSVNCRKGQQANVISRV